eukprot:scaffold3204_cov185-Alexandrium_tamarense.AAC.9
MLSLFGLCQRCGGVLVGREFSCFAKLPFSCFVALAQPQTHKGNGYLLTSIALPTGLRQGMEATTMQRKMCLLYL